MRNPCRETAVFRTEIANPWPNSRWKAWNCLQFRNDRLRNYPEATTSGTIWPQPVAKLEANDLTQPAQSLREAPIGQQAVARLPWARNTIRSQKLKDNGLMM